MSTEPEISADQLVDTLCDLSAQSFIRLFNLIQAARSPSMKPGEQQAMKQQAIALLEKNKHEH
jgi:hypothetical protein